MLGHEGIRQRVLRQGSTVVALDLEGPSTGGTGFETTRAPFSMSINAQEVWRYTEVEGERFLSCIPDDLEQEFHIGRIVSSVFVFEFPFH